MAELKSAVRDILSDRSETVLDNVLVSVIIPAFNAEADIGEALQSVLVQTHQSIEVIVVDDGSSDDTGAIVEKFVRRDARVQLMRQCNLGVGAARNAGIRKARGKYASQPRTHQQIAAFDVGVDRQVVHLGIDRPP